MTSARKPELAVFGGSFSPPHVGHVFLATYALSIAGVERVLVAPTYQHAFGKHLAPFEHRLAMCELAFAPLRNVEVSSIEQDLGGVSRTLRLVHELSTRYPNHQLRLLVGTDILNEKQRWHHFDDIVAVAPLLVAQRAGYATRADAPLLPEVSSTRIRDALAHTEQPEGWLPCSVREYIEAHALYHDETS